MGHIDVIAEKIFESEFYDEIGTPEYIQNRKAQIAAWLETNIGHLNILINQSYRVDFNNNVCPLLKEEEEAIFIQLYLKYYYKRQAQSILKSVSSVVVTPGTPNQTTSMSDWTELREGDSSIKRVAQTASPQQKVQMSQAYKSFSSEAEAKLKDLVHSYNMYRASPRQVAGMDAPQSGNCCSSPESCTPLTPTPSLTVTPTIGDGTGGPATTPTVTPTIGDGTGGPATTPTVTPTIGDGTGVTPNCDSTLCISGLDTAAANGVYCWLQYGPLHNPVVNGRKQAEYVHQDGSPYKFYQDKIHSCRGNSSGGTTCSYHNTIRRVVNTDTNEVVWEKDTGELYFKHGAHPIHPWYANFPRGTFDGVTVEDCPVSTPTPTPA